MQKAISGIGSVKHLNEIIQVSSVKNLFLVSGKRSYETSGVKDALEKIFNHAFIDRFTDFQVNPHLVDISRGVDRYRKKSYDLIIAAGGGSAIDVAKSVRFFAYQTQDYLSILEGDSPKKPVGQPPLLVIPTTAGSGSEATHFSVIYHENMKYSLADMDMLPEYVCLDGVLTKTLSKHIAAYTGMDALCQAVESFWSVNSTEESKGFSRQAMKLVLDSLVESVENNTDESRMNMLEASHLAGKAINITKTTAAHAFSYYLSTHFRIPHGQAVGLLIDSFLLFNSAVLEDDISDERGISYVKDMFCELCSLLRGDSVHQAAANLRDLRKILSLDISLNALLSEKHQRDEFFLSVNVQRLKNNPRAISAENSAELQYLLFQGK